MKLYRGLRTDTGTEVSVSIDGGPAKPLNPRYDLRNHSPDGFEWGYGGSGPAQLALAICADHIGDDERAMAIYQSYKFMVIGRIVPDTWELTSEQVGAVLSQIAESKARHAEAARAEE